MTGYVFDPIEPLPKRWKDDRGPIRLICQPHEGYVMARRPGAAPFILAVSDLLGRYDPILPKPRINVRQALAEAEGKET